MSDVLNAFKNSKKDVPDIRYELPGSREEIFLRPFTTRDQKAILKAIEKEDIILIQEAFDQVLRNCVTSPNFDPDRLNSKDRECLLIYLSTQSTKDDISHNWRCTNVIDKDKEEVCGFKNTTNVMISDLNYEEAVEDSLIEQEVTFDSFDFTVKLKVPTRSDEKKILAVGKKEGDKKGLSQTDVFIATVSSVIKEYKKTIVRNIDDGKGGTKEVTTEVFEAIKFEDRLSMYDMLNIEDKKKIENFFKSIKNYGYDLSIPNQTCKKCSHTQDVKLEWMDFFIM